MSHYTRRLLLAFLCASTVMACSSSPEQKSLPTDPPLFPNETPQLRVKINHWADFYDLPRTLVHSVAIRESSHNPKARNGQYYGLMQILPSTARVMGFRGQNSDLLDADTNLEFALKYLRGAWLLSDGDQANAVKWYSGGYYYEAKRRGMLVETGLRPS